MRSRLIAMSALSMTLFALSGCESLTQMSDDWCNSHPSAGSNRCTGRTAEAVPAKGWVCTMGEAGETCTAPTADQSWYQANLKRNDHGCPTAIYSAPGGVLAQCP